MIIIDGWNLYYSYFSLSIKNNSRLSRKDAVEKLKLLLKRMNCKEKTVVVLDSKLGWDDFNMKEMFLWIEFVSVENADEYIKNFVDHIPYHLRKKYCIVSSDKSVYFYARDSGCKVLKCEQFIKNFIKQK